MEKNDIFEKAYINQGISLERVQEIGPELENTVKNAFGWLSGDVIYFNNENLDKKYKLQVDVCYPSVEAPEIFVSVTYCNPDTPGHSNENKLQLKLGELMLLKAKYPEIKGILVIGGTEESWLPYVIQAFQYFYDKVLFTWDPDFSKQVEIIKRDINSVEVKHSDIWNKLSKEWEQTELITGEPIDSFLRENAWRYVQRKGCEGDTPSKIQNEIIRNCMIAAYQKSIETRARNGVEWSNYMNEDWDKLWQSRSFFNPGEAAIEIILKNSKIAYLGGIAKDVPVPSLIHHLGGDKVDNTKVSEDFICFSNKLNMPIFIQSKASGGGLKRHGKNIQNRTKEQLARSLFYRGYIEDDSLKIREKDFIWISVLDGDWGVTKRTPLKYEHMLQWAGYDHLVAADSLVDKELDVITENNVLANILSEYNCETDQEKMEKLWRNWLRNKRKI